MLLNIRQQGPAAQVQSKVTCFFIVGDIVTPLLSCISSPRDTFEWGHCGWYIEMRKDMGLVQPFRGLRFVCGV